MRIEKRTVCTLKVWKTMVKENKLKGDAILKWCAYDSDFTPNRLDTRFKVWTGKGMKSFCAIMKEGTLLSFEQLKEQYLSENQDSYQYLLMRHYINVKVRNVTEAGKCLIGLFKKAYKAGQSRGIITSLYKCLLNLKTHSNLYIKTKCEKEVRITMSEYAKTNRPDIIF